MKRINEETGEEYDDSEKYSNPTIIGYGNRAAIIRPGQQSINEWGKPVSQEYIKDIEDSLEMPEEEFSQKLALQKRQVPQRPSDSELNIFDAWKKFEPEAKKMIDVDPEAEYKKGFQEWDSNFNNTDLALFTPDKRMKFKQDRERFAGSRRTVAEREASQQMTVMRNMFTKQWETKQKQMKTPNDTELTSQALRDKLGRDPTAQEIIDAKQKLELDKVRETKSVQTEGIDISSLAQSIADGQDAPMAIKGSMGNPVASKVKTEVLKKYPKFDMMMADANYKWKQSATNQRTINFVGGSLPRLGALDDQLSKMPNTDINTINRIMATVSKEFGKPEYTNFESNRNAIVQEINTALSGTSQGSDMRIKIELENLKSSRSPVQIRGAISNLRKALEARLDVDLSPLYPIEVVRGEKSMAQYKKELYNKYRNNYDIHDEGLGSKQNNQPKTGEVRKGYKFKGGNPADKNSWEKVK